MKLAIAGKNDIAVGVLDHALTLLPADQLCVVLNRTDPLRNTWQRSLGKHASARNVPILALEDLYACADLVFLSVEFDRIVKPSAFQSDRLYNIHFSLLPEYKGMFTSYLPVLQGKGYSGVTLHEIDPGIDTGDIIAQQRFELGESETCRSLYYRYLSHGEALLKQHLPALLAGKPVSHAQPSVGSSYFGKDAVDFSSKELKRRQTAQQLKQQAAALTFREYQMPHWDGAPIRGVTIESSRTNVRPGTVLDANSTSLLVATIDYDVRLHLDYFDQLLDAARTDDAARARSIIECVPDLDESDVNGWTPLIVAAFHGATNVARLLLANGASVRKANLNGTTPLMYAKDATLRTKDTSLLSLLLTHGADSEALDAYGKSVSDYIPQDTGIAWPFPLTRRA